MLLKLFIWPIAFILISTQHSHLVLAQTQKYQIYKGHKAIGILKTKKVEIGNSTSYYIESDATFRVIFEFNTQFKFETFFTDGNLCKSFAHNTLNDSERESTLINWESNKYKIIKDGKDPSILNINRPTYSMASMYYEEPGTRTEVFSERFGEYLAVKNISNAQYELTMPDGRHNIYTYKNGRCSEVEVDHMLATLYFKILL
jgi:hypothetical protein